MNTPSDPPAVIVIAEDSRIQGMVLKNRLEQAGYIAHIGADGELALDLVRRHLPKLVISDIEMPKMNGYGLCRAIKTDPSLRHIPVLLLSTLSDAEDIIQGLDVGADNYVTKPYDPAYLLSRVESMLTQPVQDDQQPAGPELKVTLHGKTYTVRSGRQQTLNLLVSTFENAVEKNRELHRSNEQLTLAKEKLTQWNAQLESLNTKLASLNQRMTHDLHAAARVQKSLLPNESQPIPGIEIAWRYIPCEELAGDFLNYARLDEHHVALYVVDVSGHGAASSLLAVAVGRVLAPQASATSLLVRLDPFSGKPVVTPPKTVVEELNRRFPMDSQGGLHFTILYGVLDLRNHRFRYACGGHPQPVLQRPGEPAEFLPGEGLAVGWVDDVEFDEWVVDLKPGERLFLYSDGIPEAMDGQLAEFTNDKMLRAIDQHRDQAIYPQGDRLLEDVMAWCQPNGPRDDISLLIVEIPSAPES